MPSPLDEGRSPGPLVVLFRVVMIAGIAAGLVSFGLDFAEDGAAEASGLAGTAALLIFLGLSFFWRGGASREDRDPD